MVAVCKDLDSVWIWFYKEVAPTALTIQDLQSNMTEPQLQQSQSNSKYWMAGAVMIASLFWILSVALPVWETRSNQSGDWDVVRGIIPALLGFLGLLFMCPAWFANLSLVPLCILLFKVRRIGFPLALVTLAIAASAYALPGIYGDNDEAVIVKRLIGFYIWLSSFVIIALAHAIFATPVRPKWIVTRVAAVLLMVLAIGSLERVFPIGVSPLEKTLKDRNDLNGFSAVLPHSSQADKDAALLWAIRQDLSEVRPEPSKQVVMLIAAGADAKQMDKGESLLVWAASRRGSESLVKLLVQAGADVNARDSEGRTVLDDAKKMGSSPECQKILVDAGARSSEH